jgi:hypothetical protein
MQRCQACCVGVLACIPQLDEAVPAAAGEQGAAGVPVNVAHIAAVACRHAEQNTHGTASGSS